MVKLKNFQAYQTENISQEIKDEICGLSAKLAGLTKDELDKHDPNIILAAISFYFAAIIKEAVSDDPIERDKAAMAYATALVKNVQWLGEINDK